MEDKTTMENLLFEYWMIYKNEQRRDVSQGEFARFIGLEETYFNHLYHGRRKPSYALTKKLAEMFDDIRFYDAADYPRPDERLHYIQSNWENLSDVTRKKISEIVTEYLSSKKK